VLNIVVVLVVVVATSVVDVHVLSPTVFGSALFARFAHSSHVKPPISQPSHPSHPFPKVQAES
jgi:hypothetical protein